MPAEAVIKDEELRATLSRAPVSTGALARQFGVSRQAVLKRLLELEVRGLAVRAGIGRGTRWQGPADFVFRWPLVVPPGQEPPAEDSMWREVRSVAEGALGGLTDEARNVLGYCVTEMLNNAIDHSDGAEVRLTMSIDGPDIVVAISDDGIGAFPRVRDHFGLADVYDAAAHLTKGRQTTAPSRHSGQGLFFTSKAVDHFEVASAGLAWRVDNIRRDQALVDVANRAGTQVLLRTAMTSTRVLKDVFDRFSDPEDYDFDRSSIRISLIRVGSEFMSRSEAKRVTAGLEVYRRVELDFAGVAGVGQGFVDELFRVWTADHPGTQLVAVNANDAVDFMLRRGLTG